MTTEMNPSPVTVTNPAETPGTTDVSPAVPVTPVAEKTQDACCDTGAKSDAKSDASGCDSAGKPAAAPAAAENCASGEKSDKPAGSCAS